MKFAHLEFVSRSILISNDYNAGFFLWVCHNYSEPYHHFSCQFKFFLSVFDVSCFFVHFFCFRWGRLCRDSWWKLVVVVSLVHIRIMLRNHIFPASKSASNSTSICNKLLLLQPASARKKRLQAQIRKVIRIQTLSLFLYASRFYFFFLITRHPNSIKFGFKSEYRAAKK